MKPKRGMKSKEGSRHPPWGVGQRSPIIPPRNFPPQKSFQMKGRL